MFQYILTDNEKMQQRDIFKNLRFIENGYFVFEVESDRPLFSDELEFDFSIFDESGRDFLTNIYYYTEKFTMRNEYGLKMWEDWNYKFLLEASPSFKIDGGNSKAKIIYPNGFTRVYTLQ